MEKCNNKKGLVKRGVAVDQLSALADALWEAADPDAPGKTRKRYGVPSGQMAGFAMGANFAASVLNCYHLDDALLKAYAIGYMREQLEEDRSDKLEDIFGYGSSERLGAVLAWMEDR